MRGRMLQRLWVGLAAGLWILPLSVLAAPLAPPPPVAIEPLPPGAAPRPVSLTRLGANIKPGTTWQTGSFTTAPYPCALGETATLQWKEEDNRISNLGVWDRAFRQELKSDGFAVGGDPNNLFEEQSSADLQVGALITAIRVESCEKEAFSGTTYGGSALMSVEWQLYSVGEGKVIGRVSTQGGFDLKQAKDQSLVDLVSGAFGDNVRRLAATAAFRDFVLSPKPRAAAGAALTTLALTGTSTDTSTPLAVAVKSVVTISAADGSGSGVLVSSDGYVLTNHHVAGSSGQVRVRWSDGSETVGDVVRSDAKRDVALVRTTPKATPLAIRRTPARLGETVFAVGTPLDKALAGTVTRGAVSATRLLEGQPFIQSDVAVTHGNSGGPLLDERGAVIGLTDWGIAPNGASANLNFFIPIDDALRVLALEPQAMAAASATAPKATSPGARPR